MATESELQHESEIADAELGVAEELGWALAIIAGLAAYLSLKSWLFALLAFAISYCASIYRYRRKAALAEDRYFKSAELGKYVKLISNNEKSEPLN